MKDSHFLAEWSSVVNRVLVNHGLCNDGPAHGTSVSTFQHLAQTCLTELVCAVVQLAHLSPRKAHETLVDCVCLAV